GNIHDSQAFPTLFSKIEPFQPHYLIADAGYKTPSIAKFLLDQNITPVFPYTRPRGKKGKLRPKDFIYDEYFDCYLCPENQELTYRTTTREGYREYKSDPKICAQCPLLSVCTESRNHQKVVTRHIWKEYHNLRYARERGKSKMEDKVGLTLVCLNIKKLVKMMAGKPFYFIQICQFSPYFGNIQKKTNLENKVCLQSESQNLAQSSFFNCSYSGVQFPARVFHLQNFH
ncbi:transposase, partial [Streptococcus varani]